MSKFLWFVIGAVVGDLAGRWMTHIIYLAVIFAILSAKHFCR